jgi:hypothetical protein
MTKKEITLALEISDETFFYRASCGAVSAQAATLVEALELLNLEIWRQHDAAVAQPEDFAVPTAGETMARLRELVSASAR